MLPSSQSECSGLKMKSKTPYNCSNAYDVFTGTDLLIPNINIRPLTFTDAFSSGRRSSNAAPRPSRTWCVRTTLCPRTFVAGGEVGLAMGLEVGGDVGGAQHLSTDAAGHLPLVSDHVGAQSVFGSEGRGTGLRGRIGARGLEGEHGLEGPAGL